MRPKFLLCLLVNLMFSVSLFAQQLCDEQATRKTRNLYQNLTHNLDGILFGHQDDLAYGSDWKDELGRSDVLEVTGKYPAVIGWDLGKLGETKNLDGVDFSTIRKGIKYAYKKGAVNTISWHMENPLTGKNAWDTIHAVSHLLPGGSLHQKYLQRLDQFVAFIKKCRVGLSPIPIVFRPYHEHNGTWFWWGKNVCTEQEYIQLWRFTVDYIQSSGVHNLIYAFSPDKSRINSNTFKADYFYGYPGDQYVDIIGLDNYWDVGSRHNHSSDSISRIELTNSVRQISLIANEKNKVAALTETGNSGLHLDNWYTSVLLEPIKNAAPNNAIAWVMVWRNASKEYFYVPYKGHPQESDFKKFETDQQTLFLGDFKNLYK